MNSIRLHNIKIHNSSKIISVNLDEYGSYQEFVDDLGDVNLSDIKLDPSQDVLGMILGFPDVSKMISNVNKVTVDYDILLEVSRIINSPDIDQILPAIKDYYIGEFDGYGDFITKHLKLTVPNPYGYWIERCTDLFSEIDSKYFFVKT